MKTKFEELEGGFFINFTAECFEDAITLARFGINRTRMRESYTFIDNEFGITTSIVFNKHKNNRNSILKRK